LIVKSFVATLCLWAFLSTSAPVRADEGMWTFDAFPSAKVAASYGFSPSKAWLDHLRESTLRIAGGCSASFVSPHGLVMTNHHCAVNCVDQLSTQQQNYVESSFYAKTDADEVPCPNFELDRLDAIDDETAAITDATKGKSGRALIDALQGKEAELTASCGKSESIRCDVVTLYHGGVYKLYHYKRYIDVRLVFTPEYAVAQFGGDPDNFNFPRYDFDVTFLRAYEAGKPAETPEYLHWSAAGSSPGDLAFVSGNPGTTDREFTISQLEYMRDDFYPQQLTQASELRGVLEQYQTEGPEQLRETKQRLFFLENSYKGNFGRDAMLLDPAFMASKVAAERALRAQVAKRPDLAPVAGDWDKLAAVERRKAQLATRELYIANGPNSDLFTWARTLVRYPVETAKPDADRFPEYSEAQLVTLPRRLFAAIPTYPGPQELTFNFWAKKMREDLGTDDPFVRQVLGSKTPAQWAHELVAGTTLADVATRKALFAGGQPAIDASQDTMIRFAASIDAQSRLMRKQYEDEVTAPEHALTEAISRARFAILGTSVYPDATFTQRLSYGTVKGFLDQNGNNVEPYTTVGGLYARATGAEPYALPQSWLNAQSALDQKTPMNFVTTNDVVGGNSGSPVVDKNGEVIGVIFDGNIFSLGGTFGYEPNVNRSVAVDSRALLAGLRTVYHADRIIEEISP
jgi:Peptidase S46